MTTTIIECIAELRTLLPAASDESIALLAKSWAPPAPPTVGSSSQPTGPLKTVREVLNEVREIRMLDELSRSRARIKADGTMRLKDTSTFRTYETTWKRLEEMYGEVPIADLTLVNIKQVALRAQRSARAKGEAKNVKRMQNGFSAISATGNAGYNRSLCAMSALFNYAVENNLVESNIVNHIKKLSEANPKRGKMSPEECDELLQAALQGGNDPVLDHLFLWTLLETGARVGGLLHMQLQDINLTNQTVTLHEKGSTERVQPVSPELAQALYDFAVERDAISPTDSVFRFGGNKSGVYRPLTSRHIDTMWARLRKQLPWVEEGNLSSHALRRSILTVVERYTSPSVARRFAGHSQRNVTEGYTEASDVEVAKAHQLIFGSTHPLAG